MLSVYLTPGTRMRLVSLPNLPVSTMRPCLVLKWAPMEIANGFSSLKAVVEVKVVSVLAEL